MAGLPKKEKKKKKALLFNQCKGSVDFVLKMSHTMHM